MTRDRGSKPDRATTVEQGVVHESHGAGTAIAQEVSAMTIIGEEMSDARELAALLKVTR